MLDGWHVDRCWQYDLCCKQTWPKHCLHLFTDFGLKPFMHLFILRLTLYHTISKQLQNRVSTSPTNMTSSPAFNFQQIWNILVDWLNHVSPHIISINSSNFIETNSTTWRFCHLVILSGWGCLNISSPQQDTPATPSWDLDLPIALPKLSLRRPEMMVES